MNFLMLNPSVADAELDDPTVRRTQGFASSWCMGGVVVTNIFSLRSTDPAALYSAEDPIGPDNDAAILDAARSCGRVILAWGVHGGLDCVRRTVGSSSHGRGAAVVKMLNEAGVKMECLGVTKDGFPRHPLYLASKTQPITFDGVRP